MMSVMEMELFRRQPVMNNSRLICTTSVKQSLTAAKLRTVKYQLTITIAQYPILVETFINLEGQKIAGEIISVSARRIDDWIGDDEFEACVTFRNNGTINTEYDLQLFSEKGKLIDTEPDSYEINLKVGENC